MAQDDFTVANADGATVRADINSNIQALATVSSGASTPGTPFAFQLWADTTNNVLKQRNSGNDGWLIRGTLAEAFLVSKTSGDSPYTVLLTDYSRAILCNATSGAITINLLAAATAGDGFEVSIKKTDSSTNVVTVDGNGSETIDGATTIELGLQYHSVKLRCDGSNWHIIDEHVPDDVYVLTDGTTVNWDVEFAPVAQVTLAGNRTMAAVTGAKEGGTYLLVVIQDGTGSRTLSWDSNYDFGDAGAPTLTTTASARDVIPFVYSNSKMRAGAIQKGFTG